MKNNLELGKKINFNELIQHGIDNNANIANNMPWSWKINGKSITHENDNCYIVESVNGSIECRRGDYLMAFHNGLLVMQSSKNETQVHNGCPM